MLELPQHVPTLHEAQRHAEFRRSSALVDAWSAIADHWEAVPAPLREAYLEADRAMRECLRLLNGEFHYRWGDPSGSRQG